MLSRPTPFDLSDWIEKNPQVHYKSPKKFTPAPQQTNRTRDAYSQARTWILKTQPAIAGNGGHAKTFGVCCSLLKGFCLNIQEAKSLLDIWNNTCVPPWSHPELESKLYAAQKSADLKIPGWMISTKPSAFGNIINQVFDDESEPIKIEEEQKYNHSGIIDDPASLAVKFFNDHKTDIGLCSYRWWQGQFYKYNDIYYEPLMSDNINADLSEYIESQFLKRYLQDCGEIEAGGDISKVTKKKVTKNLIDNVKTFLVNILMIPSEHKSEPFFLGLLPDGWKPHEVVTAKDKLIHLPSFVKNIDNSTVHKSPKYFATSSLKYKFPYDQYDGPVDPPPVWNSTLHGIWPNDQESIDCLQEFFGYFLTPCTRFQKMLMFIGHKRSGKGTILRILERMLEDKFCSSTFKALTDSFGKQALVGKNVLAFPDVRLNGRTDIGDIVEAILSISGEDKQSIKRKYLTDLNMRLTTRIVIASNELPRLTDNSGALVSRAIVLKFGETFIDREDTELEDKLIPEIPLIMRWAVDGWKRLYERKRPFQPASGAQMVADFLHLSSPVIHFISDCVDIGDDYTSDTKSLFMAWQGWGEWNGKEKTGDLDNFIRNLRAAIPKLDFTGESISHNGDGQGRRWSRPIRGLRIRPEPQGEFVLVTSDGVNEMNGEVNGHAEGVNGLVPF